MANILIVVYLLIVLAMIAVILLQRSEGGALGMGGGNSNFAPVRTSANLLTRTTAILGALFMATAIGLSIVNDVDRNTNSILESAADGQSGEGAPSVLDALNSLQGDSGPSAPVESAPVESSPDGGAATNPVDADAPNLALPDTTPQVPTNN